MEKAEQIWLQIIHKARHFMAQPYIELAKCYEHHFRDHAKALEIVDKAEKRVHLLQELDSAHDTKDVLHELAHRKARLHRKLNRDEGKNKHCLP
jgi:hypothetical protein